MKQEAITLLLNDDQKKLLLSAIALKMTEAKKQEKRFSKTLGSSDLEKLYRNEYLELCDILNQIPQPLKNIF